MQIVHLDLETTGLDNVKCYPFQIAGLIEKDNKIIDKFDLKICPPQHTIFEPEALIKTKKTKEEILSYPNHIDQRKALLNVLKKHLKYDEKYLFCAYNAHFDNQFVRKFLNEEDKYCFNTYFYSGNIDVMVLAIEFLKTIRCKLPNFKLSTVYNTFVQLGLLTEMDMSKAHDGMFDIIMTYKIYNLLRIENIVETIKKVDI